MTEATAVTLPGNVGTRDEVLASASRSRSCDGVGRGEARAVLSTAARPVRLAEGLAGLTRVGAAQLCLASNQRGLPSGGGFAAGSQPHPVEGGTSGGGLTPPSPQRRGGLSGPLWSGGASGRGWSFPWLLLTNDHELGGFKEWDLLS